MDHNQFSSSDEEAFSEDPAKNLALENEILRMRVIAELGGAYEGSENLPPDIENEFLKNILAFEQQYANAKQVKIRTLLGNPFVQPAAMLNKDEIEQALEYLEDQLEQIGIIVEFITPRNSWFKYEFITEELLEFETDDLQVEGMTKHFTYEEFHPNHTACFELLTELLLSDWFNRNLNVSSPYFHGRFLQPDGRELTKAELSKQLRNVYAAYPAFEDCQYTIGDIQFDLKETDEQHEETKGYSEGEIHYVAKLENGDRRIIEGPFKIYFSKEYNHWGVNFFFLTGFNT